MSQLTGCQPWRAQEARRGRDENGRRGPARTGIRLVAVEDVAMTGGAVLASCSALRSAGALVDTVPCAIDREEGGTANLAAQGLELRAAITRSQMPAS